MQTKISLLIVLAILFSCSSDNENENQVIDMRINHYQNTGIGEGLHLSYVVQEGDAIGTENWYKFMNDIEGFTYVPGKIYNLSLLMEQVANPPADGSSVKYTLRRIISTEDVDNETPFEIDLKINGQSFVTNNSGYEILNQIPMDCNTLCSELNTMLQHADFVTGTFKRLPNNDIQLIELE